MNDSTTLASDLAKLIQQNARFMETLTRIAQLAEVRLFQAESKTSDADTLREIIILARRTLKTS